MRFHADTDQGAFFSDAQPSKFKVGLLHSAFACYDVPFGHITAQGAYTNKAPGGVAYRCSFRVTEAMFFQERMMHAAAADLGMDQAELRRINLLRDDQFPHRTAVRLPRRLRPVRQVPADWASTRSGTRTSPHSRPRPAAAADGSASASRR